MSCHDCLSRREFLTKTTLALAGAAVVTAGCGDGQIGGATTEPLGITLTLKVSTVPALATVGQIVAHPAEAGVAVKRTGATTFAAFSRTCTHEGTRVDIVNNAFECPNHGARYDGNGNVTRQPQAPGSAIALPTFDAHYDPATDILTVSAFGGGHAHDH